MKTEISNKRDWVRDVMQATAFHDEGLYGDKEFANKVLELRRKYGIKYKYKPNPNPTDFNN